MIIKPNQIDNEETKNPKGKGCWYHTTVEECVVCGRMVEYRTRKYGDKPKAHEERYDYKQHACGEHFC